MLGLLFGKERRVRCPDGSYRYVFKSPHDAFPLMTQEWTTNTNVSADALKEIKGKVSHEVTSRINSLLFHLDGKNASVQQKCCAAYVVYKVDPCGKDGWLEREIKSILAEESFLRRLDAVIEQIRLGIAAKLPTITLLRRIDSAMASLQLPEAAIERKKAFSEAPQLASEWREEPNE